MQAKDNELLTLHCMRCGYEWKPVKQGRPGVCPRCKAHRWDTPSKWAKKATDED